MTETRPAIEMECFGWLYEPLLAECRTCPAVALCKSEVDSKIKQHGPSSFEKLQKDQVINTEKKIQSERDEEGNKDTEVSEIVSSILQLCARLGLQAIRTNGYIALVATSSDGKRPVNVLSISRVQAKEFFRVVRFWLPKTREDFPESIRHFISKDRVNRDQFYVCTAGNLKDLETVLVACFNHWFEDEESVEE